MPPWREEALKWLPPEREIAALSSLCELETTFLAEGRVFQVRLLLPGCFESFCQQVDSKIVLWMWREAMLVYVQALWPLWPVHTLAPWQCWCDAALQASVDTLSILVASEPLRIATDSISREQKQITAQPGKSNRERRRERRGIKVGREGVRKRDSEA